MAWLYLNHFLHTDTPTYGGMGKAEIIRDRSMSCGDSSNNTSLKIPGHIGTHLDAAYHFDPEGKTLDQYPADFWLIENPHLIDIQVEPAEIIGLEKVKPQLNEVSQNCDCLLIRTGAERWRTKAPETYSKQGPGLAPALGIYLRNEFNLKFIGFDFISVSSFQNRELGREAHRALLHKNASTKPPVLPIEDMSLQHLKTKPEKMILSPLIFDKSDGSPVTVLARVP